jgi:type IV pilus assembly protein PilB
MPFTDEWLVNTIEPLLPDGTVAGIRAEQASASASLWETLVQQRLITDPQILSALGTRFRIPIADLSRLDPKLAQTVPEQVARRFNVVPVGQTDSYLEVATANPFDIDAEKMLAFATGREVRMLLASPSTLRHRLDDLYRNDDVVNRLLEGLGGDFEVKELEQDDDDAAASAEEASQRPIIRLVDVMLADGVTSRASDIHVEPIEGGVVVRYRIDGVLR